MFSYISKENDYPKALTNSSQPYNISYKDNVKFYNSKDIHFINSSKEKKLMAGHTRETWELLSKGIRKPS